MVHEALQDASSLPVLLDGVHDVRPLPHATLVLMDGAEPWEVQIVDRSPVHITWDRIDGPGSAEVRLRPAGPRGTKMHVLVYEVDDVDACEKVLQRELGHLQAAIRELASPPVHPWGVAGPW